jgi:hypothetical protein
MLGYISNFKTLLDVEAKRFLKIMDNYDAI